MRSPRPPRPWPVKPEPPESRRRRPAAPDTRCRGRAVGSTSVLASALRHESSHPLDGGRRWRASRIVSRPAVDAIATRHESSHHPDGRSGDRHEPSHHHASTHHLPDAPARPADSSPPRPPARLDRLDPIHPRHQPSDSRHRHRPSGDPHAETIRDASRTRPQRYPRRFGTPRRHPSASRPRPR